MILEITKANFLEWYFNYGQDSENEAIREELAEKMINMLFNKNVATITVEEIFNECNQEAIRASFIEGYDDEDERELSDLELEDYEVKLID